MERNIFSPRLQSIGKDSLCNSMTALAQGILALVFGLLPIFFIPGVYTSLGFTKVYFLTLGVFGAIIFLSLSILRSGNIRVVVPPALAFYWLFTLVAIASSLLSGDVQDSLYGNSMEVHTASFLVLLGLIMTSAMSFSGSKSAVTRLFIALGAGALVLQVFHISRLVLGSDFLSFGMFTNQTSSPLGGFNDLAIFSGLVILVTLVSFQHLALNIWKKSAMVFMVLSSLVLLAVINFYTVWLIVGFLSLLMFLYLMSKDTWLNSTDEETAPVSKLVLSMVGIVCLLSAAFVISGDYLGGVVSRAVDVNYLEVRPSVTATLDITKSTLSENALLGAGPNRFEDSWRMYKNPMINTTVFWNSNFTAGSGYIPTLFANTGLAGGSLLIVFLLSFLYLGYRTQFLTKVKDNGWYFVGTISFISATYLWLMAVLYVPGVTILALAALMTGISFAVYLSVMTEVGVSVNVTESKQYGLLLIASVLVVLITSTIAVINVSGHFNANVTYANTVRDFQNGGSISAADQGLIASQELNDQDLFVSERAQLRLVELNNLSNVPTADFDQQKYSTVLSEGIQLAELAINLDPTSPANYILLSNFYGLLDPNEFEGLRERTESLFAEARKFDPTNPIYLVLKAQYLARIGDIEGARADLTEAVRMKSDYTDALFLLSQLDIQAGNTESAIVVTRAIISIEPTNPTRYFQLGILLATTNNFPAAINAFETAVSLDNNYANARYFLALTYLDTNRADDALVQLKIVEENNKDNTVVRELISQVESGDYVKAQASAALPVTEGGVVSQEGDVTTASEVPDTNLVTPINNSSTNKPQEASVETPAE